MATKDITQNANLTSNTSPAATDRLLLVDDGTTTLQDMALSVLSSYILAMTTHTRGATIGNPNGYYTAVRAQVPIFLTPAAITITKIVVKGADSTPTSEFAGDLKFADDIFTGGFANAAVIDVCDTTSGSFEASSGFDDATVPAGKYIYLLMDSAPHADWKDLFVQINFTYD